MFEKVDFVGGWKKWFVISGILILAGVAAIAFGRLNFGIDFTGGAKFTTPPNPEHQLSRDQIQNALPAFVRDEAIVQNLGNQGYEIRTPVLDSQQQTKVEESLANALGVKTSEISATSVSPTFGQQVRNQALQAVGAALLIIVLFISMRF